MQWFFVFAVFFILWWIVLFAVLPFRLKTQDENGDVIQGTVSSSPCGAHVLQAMILSTIISLILISCGWFLVQCGWFDFERIPRVFPVFD